MFDSLFDKVKIKARLNDWLEEISRNKVVLQAVLVGLISGILVVLFKLAIEGVFGLIHSQMADYTFSKKMLFLPLITTIGGLISGILVFKFAPETRGSGIPYIKMTLTRIGGVIRLRSIFVKFFAGVAGIGTGLSLGREGPSVQLGAGAGAVVSRAFHMQGQDQDKLIAAGAGSAIGATFNAPIAGTIFVLEELLQKFSSSLLFPTLAATVTASSIARYFLGNNPAFQIPMLNDQVSGASLLVCIILGFVAGVLGMFFAKLIYFCNNYFERLKNLPNWVKPGIAGLAVGVIGLLVPLAMGAGNYGISLLLEQKLSLPLIFIIFIVKFFITPFCFGSGAAGGIFLPMLLLGSFLGYIIASVASFLGLHVDVVAVSLVGMAAFLTAVARTPITAVVMVFEMTGGYNYILPIMLSAAIADLTAKRFRHKPIYAKLMLQQAQNSEEAKILGKMNAKSIMAENVTAIPVEMSIADALEIIKEKGHMLFPVIDKKKKFLGIVTKSDVNDAVIQGKSKDMAVEKIMNPSTVVAYPDTDLYTVYFRMHVKNSERAVIIDRRKYVKGIITRSDIHNAAGKKNEKA